MTTRDFRPHQAIQALETQYYAQQGCTYTLLKAQTVPDYYELLDAAVRLRLRLTDKDLGIAFPAGADQ